MATSSNAFQTPTSTVPAINISGNMILSTASLVSIKNKEEVRNLMAAEVNAGVAMLKNYSDALNAYNASIQLCGEHESNRRESISNQLRPYLDRNLRIFSLIHW